MIHCDNVRKSYAAQEVLRGVTLQVENGEIFGFVGPNGAGKTTFLKCLLGMCRPQQGKIQMGSIDARHAPLAVRKICAYAPSETSLYDSMSVWNLLAFALAGYPQADLQRARQLLDLYQLPSRLKVRALSHGMKRKLLLAQALASQAPILLLDEPMEGLDPEARRLLESQLRAEAEQGRTILFSSHDLASVERVCDRVAFLHHGKLLSCDTVENILHQTGHLLQIQLRTPCCREQLPSREGWHWRGAKQQWSLQYTGNLEDVLAQLSTLPLQSLRDASGSLEEVFESLYGTGVEI